MSESHYEKRLEADLERIRTGITDVAEKIETALKNSLTALLTLDKNLASETILGDLPINRATRQNDRLCHAFVALHLPSAGHLRFISTVMKMNLELERVGDYAVTICRETVQLSAPLDPRVQQEVERLSKDSVQMLHQAIEAFRDGNADLARATLGFAEQIDRGFAIAFEELVREGQDMTRGVRDLFGTLVIFNRFERVSDQAKNICEGTIFAVTGEEKQPKIYRVAFLEQGEGLLARLAVAIARKAFPGSGHYEALSSDPSGTPDRASSRFAESRGLDVSSVTLLAASDTTVDWGEFHVIVALSASARDLVGIVPFRTVLLTWDSPGPPAADVDDESKQRQLDGLYRSLANGVRDLMETLRGSEAS